MFDVCTFYVYLRIYMYIDIEYNNQSFDFWTMVVRLVSDINANKQIEIFIDIIIYTDGNTKCIEYILDLNIYRT